MTVEILGRACVAPSARNAQELLDVLLDGICTVTSIPSERWNKARFWHPTRSVPGKAYTFAAGVIDDVFDFDPALFGLSSREAANMDPQQRVLLQTVWRAIEDAHVSISQLRAERVGVYIGASSLDSGNLQAEDPASGSPHFMTGNTLSIISNRISHIFGLSGPSMTIDTACSSSLVALHQARQALENDEIDTAIVGGVNLLFHPFSFIGFSQARMLSPEGLCRAYGENGEGYVRAEGAGAVVLRRSDRVASEGGRSRATLVATGMNSSGRTNGISLPSSEAQAHLLRSVYEENGLDTSDLAFIEGHGTGTKVGDPAELWAIGTVLAKGRAEPLPIGSIKSNIGHAEPASGILGLIKAILSLENDIVPASLHADELNSAIDFADLNIEVNRKARALDKGHQRRLAGINSFGFGGTNVHVVISDPPRRDAQGDQLAKSVEPFVISAHSSSALRTRLEDYCVRLSTSGDEQTSLLLSADGDLMALRHRFACFGGTPDNVATAIKDYLEFGNGAAAQSGEKPGQIIKTAFVYAGNGSQWAGMGIDAYRENESFRSRFDAYSRLFAERTEFDLSALLQSGDLEAELSDTRVAQAILFAVQAALTDCLAESGIKPDVVFGHSVGEIAAAYAAGILDAGDAATIVAVRSRHQHSLAGAGTMAAVVMSEDHAISFAARHHLANIVVAGVNAHNSVTISGPVEEIKRFKALAQAERYAVHILDINYPFHHPIIDREKAAFLDEIPALQLNAGHTTFISTVTGVITDGRALDAEYWWHNVREPIAFEPAVKLAIAEECNLFLEVSPRPILSNYVLETAKQSSTSIAALPTLTRPGVEPGNDTIRSTVLRAIAHGAKVGPRSTRLGATAAELPGVPFETLDCRSVTTTDSLNIFGRDNKDGPYTLLGWRSDPNSSVWKNHIDAHLFPDLAGHVVDGKSILPGSAFIEIALQAAQQYYGAADLEITNLEIFRPLELRDNKLSELLTKLSAETGVIEICSREYLSGDGWTVHATARSRKPTDALGVIRPVSASAPSLTHSINSVDAYRTARSFGLDYAPCFRLLERADVFDSRSVHVDLHQAAKPVHPYLNYGLDPVSTDAAFHGMVALFGILTGEPDGAPYIPVRFGSVRFSPTSKTVARAVIELQSFSPFSLKASIDLIASDGTLVASLDDCRFRRTWLRQHHTLGSVSFHYQAIPVNVRNLQARSSSSSDKGLLLGSSLAARELDDASLMLDAAVQRAAFDIAEKLAGPDRLVQMASLPGSRQFQCYLSSCLYGLVDAGMADQVDQGWIVASACDLPSVDELLRQVNDHHPDRVAEAVLVNDAFQETLKALETSSHDDVETGFFSNATLDHVRQHTPLAREREQLILRAIETVLADIKKSDGFTIVEAGAVSAAFSQRLADMASEKGARLVILESSDHLRRTLEINFEADPSVVCYDPDQAVMEERADLVMCASGYCHGSLGRSDALKAILRVSAATGGHVIAAEVASSAFVDFVFGMTDGWFSESATPEFPIGQSSSETQWSDLLRDCGFFDPEFTQIETAGGSLLLVEAKSTGRGEIMPEATPIDFATVVEIVSSRSHAETGLVCEKTRLLCSADNASDIFETFLAERHATPLAFIFSARKGKDKSTTFQDDVLILSAFTEAVRNKGQLDALGAPVKLFILAEGGAPTGEIDPDPAASGIWTFARVLQNEYSELDVVLIDPADDQSLRASAIRELLSSKHANKEWVQHRTTGALSAIHAVTGPSPHAQLKTKSFESATIRQASSGRIDSIKWEETSLPVPGLGEVVIEVAATGLNFRDVMWSMGLLPEEALEDGFAGATIGMEMSGTVVAIGDGVDDLSLGDAVMGIAPKALSTHVVVAREGVTRVPEGIDNVAAATIPVAFLTAYYAMVELGRIREGETILIHGAAGGVGLAALQIAKLFGAKVIATAGTVEKRRFLTLLGADHVFDSRSLSFVGDTLRVTDGKGVDLVLNSLFAEAMERSFELVKPFGRFLELGKRDYYSDRKLALRPFRRNVSYFGIDADQLLVNVPDVTRRIFTEVGALFSEGKLTPLPYRAFGFDEVASAFRLMQNAGHIGKIVIRPPAADEDFVLRRNKDRLELSHGVYLVVGGVGGFGLAAADWLARRGASHVALCTRRGTPDDETLAALERWKADGVVGSVHACDVSDVTELDKLLEKLRRYGPLKGIVHAAMVLEDGLISNLDRNRNRLVIEVKADGASNLDRLTRKDRLELFLLFSSATTMIGNPGQGNYVAANGYLEGLARMRRSEGLPALAVGFGAIADAGFLSRNSDVGDILARRIGKTALKAKSALGFVEQIILSDSGDIDAATVMVAEIDWASAASLPITSTPLFSAVPRHVVTSTGGDGEQVDLAALVAGKSTSEAQTILHEFLATEIASILKVAEDTIRTDKVLKDIGLDSLMMMELGTGFQQKTGVDIPLSGMGDGATIGDVVRKLQEKLTAGDGTNAVTLDDSLMLTELTEKHGAHVQERKSA